ncbi:MAG: hypothetical protein Q4A55_02445 [Aerococcus sp.]|nr:hypothetical protein [Aerococcus sp.]
MVLKIMLKKHWPRLFTHGALIVMTLLIPSLFHWSIDTWESLQLVPLIALVGILFLFQQFYFLFSNQKSLTLITNTKRLFICEGIYWLLAIFYWTQTTGLPRYLVIIHWLLVHSYVIAQGIHPLLPTFLFSAQLVLFQANLNYAIGKVMATGWLNLISGCLLLASYLFIAISALKNLSPILKRRSLLLSLLLLIASGLVLHFLTAFHVALGIMIVLIPVLLSVMIVMVARKYPMMTD